MKLSFALTMSAALLACGLAWAGSHDSKTKMDPKAQMDMMKAEMMKCAVCKNLGAHMDELAPVMKSEAVKLDMGVALLHTISDESKVSVMHAACDAMTKAGASTMKMTDEEAAKNLCTICQDIRNLAKAGAQVSSGNTRNGSMLVIVSPDPAVQAKVNAFEVKCAAMMGGS